MRTLYPSINLFIVLFFLGCDAEIPLSESEQLLSERAEIILSMDDKNFDLTISTNANFSQISYLQFKILFNYDKYSINGYTNGDGTKVWSNLDDPNLNHDTGEFIFSSIKNDQTIVTIDFSKPSNYDGTRIILDELIIRDTGNNNIYFSCDNPSFEDPVICRLNGGKWIFGINFYPRSTCYIDEAPETLEMDEIFEWADHYCDVKHDDGP